MVSSVRPKADRRKKTPTDAQIVVAAAAAAPTTEIARRAFELYCARGRQHGLDLDDWLRAERELVAPPSEQRRRPARKTPALD